MIIKRMNKQADISQENLRRIFTVAEHPESTLGRIDREIAQNMARFLRDHIIATEKDLTVIENDFSDPDIPEHPIFVSDYTDFLMDSLVAQSVVIASMRVPTPSPCAADIA